jgi:hypothetical protein
VATTLLLDIKKTYLFKNDLAVLALIAANKWQRPIYFTSLQEVDELGLGAYVRMEGLSYRLVPVANNEINDAKSYRNIMEKFGYGNAALRGVYFDEENRRHLNSIRASHAILALDLAERGKLDSAKKVLRKYDQEVSADNVPYGMTSNRQNQHNRVSMSFLLACHRAGDDALAKKVSASLKKDLEEQMRYYRLLGDHLTDEQMAQDAMGAMQGRPGNLSNKQMVFVQDIVSSYQMLQNLAQWEKEFGTVRPGAGERDSPIINNPVDTPN